MRFAATIVFTALTTAGALAPVVVASGQEAQPPSVGVRLVDVPADRGDDPRAQTYIIDHVAPGTTIERRIQVTNRTQQRLTLNLYAGAASIAQGRFAGSEGRGGNDLADWTTVAPPTLDLRPGAAGRATVRIAVVRNASPGERYGVVWVELPSGASATPGVAVVNRVGVRMYLSVGPGGEPESDFEISTLRGRREADGTPVVEALVRNTGGRALDMRGSLELTEGPGGLRAGPFDAQLGTTLGLGQSAAVRVPLDGRIPDGPWKATITLQSGRLERKATATLTFPNEAGRAADPVEAEDLTDTGGGRAALAVAVVLLALVLFVLSLMVRRMRRMRRSKSGDLEAQSPTSRE